MAWRRHDSPREKFSIIMPGQPHTERTPADPVSKSSERIALVSSFGTASYGVDFVDFGKPRTGDYAQSTLDAALRGMLRGEGWSLREERHITLDGFPGRRIICDISGSARHVPMVATMKIFMVDERFYIIKVVTQDGGATPAEIDRFLDSFRLLGP